MDMKKIIIIISIVIIILVLVIVGLVVLPSMLNSSAQDSVDAIAGGEEQDIEEEKTALSLEEQSKQVFNQMFETYETGEDETLNASSVAVLFDTIANHNQTDKERQIDVNGTIITLDNRQALKQILTNDTKYGIKCIYGDDGYIKTIELRYVSEQEENGSEEATNQSSEENQNSIENPVQ